MSKELKTASVLAFERKLDTSDALFFSGSWAKRADSDWPAVQVREKSVRGTISNRLEAGSTDALKLDKSIENANLQTVDVANLPLQHDTLKVVFTLKVLGGTGTPSACNDASYREKLLKVVDGYVQEHGFRELARRYAANLANGRFLWRNRVGAEYIEVQVAQLQDGKDLKTWRFKAHEHSVRTLSVPAHEEAALSELASAIEAGLSGKSFTLFRVTAFARVGEGQEVYPSQELILKEDKGKGNSKSKVLYVVGEGSDAIAAVHSQKIGNALRSIDTWYEGAEQNGPIAVEPYGSVTSQGKAYRAPKEKQDFYSLFDNWILKDKVPAIEQQHFVIANLVRGGVFSKAG